MTDFSQKQYRIAAWLIFSALFIYLVLRAWFVEPLKDELMTFFFFIEDNSYIGPALTIDSDGANNHLLNSFLASLFNKFDNGSFFLMRIPNLLAFPFYFLGVAKLLENAGKNWQRIIVLLAVVCVPFTLEYFAATRGYGLSMAFMVWMIFFTRKWLRGLRISSLVAAYLCAWLMVSANLTYLTMACICAGILAFFQFVQRRELVSKQHLSFVTAHIVFFAALVPFAVYAGKVKEAGAFYYGSLDGFWVVTCKSVLRYTIFYDAGWLKRIVFFFLFALFLLAFRSLWKHRISTFSKLPETVLYFFLGGSIAAIILMAKLLHVNYPEDRVAMNLVPVTLLLVGLILLRSRFSAATLLLAFFPLVFIAKMNLDTSVISPDDRMNTQLYESVRNRMNDSSTVAGYYTLPLMWSWMERGQTGLHQEMKALDTFSPYYDFVFTRANTPVKPKASGYTLIGYHKGSSFRVWKRNEPVRKKEYARIKSAFAPSHHEFLQLASVPVTDSMRRKPWLFTATLNLQLDPNYKDVMLVFSTIAEDGSTVRYEQYQLDYGHGLEKKSIPIHQHYIFDSFDTNEKELRIYIWNRQRSNMYFYDGLVTVYQIQPENGIR